MIFFEGEMLVQRIRKNITGQGKITLPLANDSLFLYRNGNLAEFIDPYLKLKETRQAYWRRMDDSAGFRNPPERTIFGSVFKPYKYDAHFKYSQASIDKMILENRIRLKCKSCKYEHMNGVWNNCPKCGSSDATPQYLVQESDKQVLDTNWLDIAGYSHTTGFSTENSEILLDRAINVATDKNDLVMDFFSGSGTTLAVSIKKNRKWIGVEQGEQFYTVIKPRIQKVIFEKGKKDGKPCKIDGDNGRVGVSPRNGDGYSEESGSIDDVGLRPPYDSLYGGVSQIVKVLKLESYEDTLNNLELKQPTSDLLAHNEALQNDYLLHYMLDMESRESLLNTQHFAKPFDYQLNIAITSAGAYEAKTIDLVETFNYLIGLRVSEINDKRENGLVTVQGTNTSGEKTLIIWRDCEKYDYDKLNRYLDSRDINPQDSEFDVVYINGDHNVPTVFADSDESVKTLKVRSIEAEFLSKMFGE